MVNTANHNQAALFRYRILGLPRLPAWCAQHARLDLRWAPVAQPSVPGQVFRWLGRARRPRIEQLCIDIDLSQRVFDGLTCFAAMPKRGLLGPPIEVGNCVELALSERFGHALTPRRWTNPPRIAGTGLCVAALARRIPSVLVLIAGGLVKLVEVLACHRHKLVFCRVIHHGVTDDVLCRQRPMLFHIVLEIRNASVPAHHKHLFDAFKRIAYVVEKLVFSAYRAAVRARKCFLFVDFMLNHLFGIELHYLCRVVINEGDGVKEAHMEGFRS